MTQSETTVAAADRVEEGQSPCLGLTAPAVQRAGTTIITKHFDFEAAHFLPHVPDGHKCRRVHGHSYQVWVHVSGSMDERAGWIVDFADVKDIWKTLEVQLDHWLLNDVSGLENPTAENLAAWIWRRFDDERRVGNVDFEVAAVEVAETVDSRALFVAPNTQPWVPGQPHVELPAFVYPANPDPNSTMRADTQETDYRADPRVLDKIEDVQARPDTRGVAINEVGVNRVRVPIEILDRERGRQSTVATVVMAVDLPAAVKGTHLSRFIQVLRDHQDALTLMTLAQLTGDLRARLGAGRARVRLEFPYFITKAAPVTGELGDLDVDCAFEIIDTNGALEHWMEVHTPVTTVCPCSRDISDYGAHNQRGRVDIRIRCVEDEAQFPTLVWIEELVALAEGAGSSPLYSVVKRSDERHLTMAGYDNPKFVEDVVRDAVVALRTDDRITAFEVTVKNDESIHAHNAFAHVSE